jgi:hypothetical protein
VIGVIVERFCLCRSCVQFEFQLIGAEHLDTVVIGEAEQLFHIGRLISARGDGEGSRGRAHRALADLQVQFPCPDNPHPIPPPCADHSHQNAAAEHIPPS